MAVYEIYDIAGNWWKSSDQNNAVPYSNESAAVMVCKWQENISAQ